jgi:hypothetical protein
MNKYKKTTVFFAIFTTLFMMTFPVFAAEGVLTHQAEVQKTSVVLHGFAPTGENHTRKAYFEWGETSALGTQTQWKDVSRFFPSTSNVSYSLFRLDPETKYYYRLVVLDPEVGTLYGEVKSFTTPKIETSRLGSVLGFSSGTNQTNTKTNNQITTGNTPSSSRGGSNANQNIQSRSGLLASLFGWGGDTNDTANTTSVGVEDSQEEVSNSLSLLPNSFLGWIVLALLIFLVTSLLVYVANLYRRLKELKKKKKEEKKAVPVNLPII